MRREISIERPIAAKLQKFSVNRWKRIDCSWTKETNASYSTIYIYTNIRSLLSHETGVVGIVRNYRHGERRRERERERENIVLSCYGNSCVCECLCEWSLRARWRPYAAAAIAFNCSWFVLVPVFYCVKSIVSPISSENTRSFVTFIITRFIETREGCLPSRSLMLEYLLASWTTRGWF